MFSLPVGENIAASSAVDEERAWEVLDQVELSGRVRAMKDGLKTQLYNNNGAGVDVSGGEAQRLAIARALYKQADILFFDEATSALDNRTEERINRAIEELSKANRELTIVVVAHRESSLDYCDRIITLGEKTA